MQYIPKCPLIEKIMGFGVVPFADKAIAKSWSVQFRGGDMKDFPQAMWQSQILLRALKSSHSISLSL